MVSEIEYNYYINNVLQYLNAIYPKQNYLFQDKLEEIKYFMTKYILVLPQNIGLQLDEILKYQIYRKPIFDATLIVPQILIINHDITQIKVDTIVNAANADGLGCFENGHKCIDNVIHNKAGPKLRLECKKILNGSKLKTSDTIITHGYNLPSKYIIHTVGPIYDKSKHIEHSLELEKCYTNCLSLADKYGLRSIVFCCISTGIYGFPKDSAARIALNAVNKYIYNTKSKIKIIFCTYTDRDYAIYKNLIN